MAVFAFRQRYFVLNESTALRMYPKIRQNDVGSVPRSTRSNKAKMSTPAYLRFLSCARDIANQRRAAISLSNSGHSCISTDSQATRVNRISYMNSCGNSVANLAPSHFLLLTCYSACLTNIPADAVIRIVSCAQP